jgi:hypothetical protein
MYSEALEQQVGLLRWLDAGARTAPHLSTSELKYITRTTLAEGHPVYVALPICQVLDVASRGIPRLVLQESDVPLMNGFVWFARPLAMPAPPHDIAAAEGMRAFSWMRYRTNPGFDGVVVVFWVAVPNQSRPWPTSVLYWDFGSSWEDFKPHPSMAHADDPAAAETLLTCRRYVAALFSFMAQRILVAPARQAERAARKRLEREGWQHEPLIRVVELRRKERLPNDSSAAVARTDATEWSCQWVVRGHWRQQYYPSLHRNQPIWITPYVKGPEDKPLKPPRATVFAVVR